MIEDGFKIMDWRLQREMSESTLNERQIKRLLNALNSCTHLIHHPEVMGACLKGLKRY